MKKSATDAFSRPFMNRVHSRLCGFNFSDRFLKYNRYLLKVNLARYLINMIPPNLSDITLGALALGAAELLHLQLPFSIGLIVIGVILLVRSATMVKNG